MYLLNRAIFQLLNIFGFFRGQHLHKLFNFLQNATVHKFTYKKGDVIFPELGHMSNSINCPFNSFELMEKRLVIDEKKCIHKSRSISSAMITPFLV